MSSELRREWRERLAGAMIPAVPVPMRRDGRVDWDSQENYLAYMRGRPIDGVAVWAHTGRGLYLDREVRRGILASWREGLGKDKVVIAGVGGRGETEEKYLDSAFAMAVEAREGGADLAMAYPPAPFRDDPRGGEMIVAYHERLAGAGLPLLLFYLHGEGGGIPYPLELLLRLFAIESVVGIKMATFDSVVTFQDVAALLRDRVPDAILVTGEDRFLPYSFQAGAQAALIGMGATFPGFQKGLVDAWFKKDFVSFQRLGSKADEYGRVVFRAPLEGYIQRLLHVLQAQGIIAADGAFDPFGPELAPGDLREVLATAEKLELA